MTDVIELIKNAVSVAVIPHVNADGDAVASCRAMAEVLLEMGKECAVYSEEPIEKRLSFLADGINVYDGAPKAYEICIVLDCGDLERVGSRKPLLEAAGCVVNIDHHKTNTYFGDANLVVPSACATGEILANLFDDMGLEITRKTAEYLYAAICSDSGCFKYSNVSANTMRIAARLMETGIDHAKIAALLFDTHSLEEELMRAEVIRDMRSYCGGRVRVVSADETTAKKYGLGNDELQGLVDIPRRIEGTEIGIAIKALDGRIRASLRSSSDADVAEISRKFGGGGHAKAAGCTVDAENIAEAEKLLVSACEEALG